MHQLQEKNAGQGMCRSVWGLYWCGSTNWLSDCDSTNLLPRIKNYFDIEMGDANLDEIKDKLLGLKDTNMTYNWASSNIVTITSAGSTWNFMKSID